MPQDLAVGVKMISRYDDRFYAVTLLNGEIRYLPSVTTYLSALNKEWLPRLRGDIGNREADIRLSDAAERGSRIHHACYIYATGGVVMFEYPAEMNFEEAVEIRTRNAQVVAQCNAQGIRWYKLYRQNEMEQHERFVKWCEIVKPKFICAEQVFWSLELNMAGTLDYVVYIDQGEYAVSGKTPVKLGGTYVIDVKSGFAFDEGYYLQMSGYKKLYEQRRNAQLTGTIGLHLNSSTRTGIPGVSTYVTEGEKVDEHFERLMDVQRIWQWQNPNAAPKAGAFRSITAREKVEEGLVYGGVEAPTAHDIVKSVVPAGQEEQRELSLEAKPEGTKDAGKARKRTAGGSEGADTKV